MSSHSSSERPGPAIHSVTIIKWTISCSFPVRWHQNCSPKALWKTTLSAGDSVQGKFFCLWSHRLHSFPRSLTRISSARFPTNVSYICDIDRFITFCVPSWNLWTSSVFFFFVHLHTFKFTLYCKLLWILTSALCPVFTMTFSCE